MAGCTVIAVLMVAQGEALPLPKAEWKKTFDAASDAQKKGDYSTAESKFRRALQLTLKEHDGETPVAFCADGLAAALIAQGKYSAAETELRRALVVWRSNVGNLHPNVARTLNNLANVLKNRGQYREAEQTFREAVALYRRQKGAYHPDVIRCAASLAQFYFEVGRFQRALDWYGNCLVASSKSPGNNRGRAAYFLDRIANAQMRLGRISAAEPAARQALAARQQLYGGKHPAVADSKSTLAYVYLLQQNFEQATGLLPEIPSPQEIKSDADHHRLMWRLYLQALAKAGTGEPKEAASLLEKAAEVCETHRLRTADVARVLEEYGRVLKRLKLEAKAEQIERRAKDVKKSLSF